MTLLVGRKDNNVSYRKELVRNQNLQFTDFYSKQATCSIQYFNKTEQILKYIANIGRGFPGNSVGKESSNAGDSLQWRRPRFNPWIGNTPWRREWQYPLQYSCLGNPMDRGAWWATVTRIGHNLVTNPPIQEGNSILTFVRRYSELGEEYEIYLVMMKQTQLITGFY